MWDHVSRATTWKRVRGKFGPLLPQRKWQLEVVRRTRDKKTTPLQPIFCALSETNSAISLVQGLVFSGLNPTAKFHPNPWKFPRFISENDVSDSYSTIIGDPIGYRIADK